MRILVQEFSLATPATARYHGSMLKRLGPFPLFCISGILSGAISLLIYLAPLFSRAPWRYGFFDVRTALLVLVLGPALGSGLVALFFTEQWRQRPWRMLGLWLLGVVASIPPVLCAIGAVFLCRSLLGGA